MKCTAQVHRTEELYRNCITCAEPYIKDTNARRTQKILIQVNCKFNSRFWWVQCTLGTGVLCTLSLSRELSRHFQTICTFSLKVKSTRRENSVAFFVTNEIGTLKRSLPSCYELNWHAEHIGSFLSRTKLARCNVNIPRRLSG